MVAPDSRSRARPYGGRMDNQREPTNRAAAAFQAEGGEHLATPGDEDPRPAAGFQAESQEHAASPAGGD